VSNIEGIPEGWELVAVRRARYMENYIWTSGMIVLWQERTESGFIVPIIRKIEKPATYRPFANAEEFKPHRDRWWTWKDDRSNTFPPAGYGKLGHHSQSWSDSFDRKVFDDGTPFGVEVQ